MQDGPAKQQGTEASEEPYVATSESPPEITVKAVALGAVLSVLLAGANAYLGLKVGLTISAAIPAAVISMFVFRFFRKSNILENSMVQTAASSGEALASGVIFTLPALVVLRYWQGFPFLPVTAVALAGGVLGVLFTIPLRRALIVEARLRFPEGVAAGEVLKAGAGGGRAAKSIAVGAAAAGLLKLCQTGFGVVSSTATGAFNAGGAILGLGGSLAASLLGVGYIVGLNIAVLVFLGGAISWFLGIPLYTALAHPAELAIITGGASGYEAAQAVWSERIRYLGVGAMAVGGVWTLVSLARPIWNSVLSSARAARRVRSDRGAAEVARTERDAPVSVVLYGAFAMAVPIFAVFFFVVDRDALGLTTWAHLSTIVFGVLFALVAGFLFSSVAAYIAGLVGSSNTPVSGVTITAILTFSLTLLLLLGSQIDLGVDAARATAAAATTILVGGIVCCAAAMGADNLQDLKAGHIVGATPFKQQVMQAVGVIAASLCVAPMLSVLFQAYGLGDAFPREGMAPSQALAAPQATLMASVSEGVFAGGLPWSMLAIGVSIAAAVIALDKALETRGSSFRMPVLVVSVGLYLPIELSAPVFVGGLVAHLAGRALSRRRAAIDEGLSEASCGPTRRGLLFASGLIAGEAVVGILLAVPFAIAQGNEILFLSPGAVGASPQTFSAITDALGIIAFILFAAWLYRIGRSVRG